jgi:hypothetical protein
LKPLRTLVVTVATTEPPCATLTEVRLTPKLKSGVGAGGGGGGAAGGLTVSLVPATALL